MQAEREIEYCTGMFPLILLSFSVSCASVCHCSITIIMEGHTVSETGVLLVYNSVTTLCKQTNKQTNKIKWVSESICETWQHLLSALCFLYGITVVFSYLARRALQDNL